MEYRMALPELPVWPRIILCILTVLSFLPVLHRICSTEDSSGISIYYALFNFILASQQFAVLVLLIACGRGPGFTHDAPTLGDWLNFTQIALLFILFLILFVLTVQYSGSNLTHIRRAKGLYLGYLLISIIPLPFFLVIGNSPKENFGVAFFLAYHFVFLNPVAMILGLSSVYFQAKRIQRRPQHVEEEEVEQQGPGLSICSLASQAVVFTALTVSWVWRCPLLERNDRPKHLDPFGAVVYWYSNPNSWVILISGVCAIVPFALLCVSLYVRHKRDNLPETEDGGEREPLLAHQASPEIVR